MDSQLNKIIQRDKPTKWNGIGVVSDLQGNMNIFDRLHEDASVPTKE